VLPQVGLKNELDYLSAMLWNGSRRAKLVLATDEIEQFVRAASQV